MTVDRIEFRTLPNVTLLTPAAPLTLGTLELHRVTSDHWLIQDHAYPPSDARHVVASLHETDEGHIEVIWLQTAFAMRTRYHHAADVLEEIASWRRDTPRGRKPVHIPHLPPAAT